MEIDKEVCDAATQEPFDAVELDIRPAIGDLDPAQVLLIQWLVTGEWPHGKVKPKDRKTDRQKDRKTERPEDRMTG